MRTQRRRLTPWLNVSLVGVLLLAWLPAQAEESPEPSLYGGSLWSRPTLSGDWGGVRDQWAARGLTVNLDATYTFQGVVSGGFDGALFERVSDEGEMRPSSFTATATGAGASSCDSDCPMETPTS